MITGAAVGIGRAVALQMAKEGAKLLLLDFNKELLEKVGEELKAVTDEIMLVACDVTDENAVNEAVRNAVDKFGGIDILVNNAALWRNFEPFCETTTQKWQTFLNVNILGVVHCTKAVLPQMLAKGYGRIINVASVAGVYGNGNMAPYSATKGAVIAMSKALAKETTGKGVLVNCVSPGTVSDSRISDVSFTEPNSMSYAGRTGSDQENADLICFLASKKASYISGQNILIDGCRKSI